LRWIPDIVRHRPQAASSVAQWAASDEARSGGVVALGLGGREAGFPPEMFEAIFARALAAGLPANPHAGEGGGEGAGAESIWGALKRLKARRIGHGVQAVNDPDLLGYLSREQIPLEVCPTSNVKLGVYSSYAMHPLKRLVAAGCMVTINSDDPGLFETGLTEEYLRAVEDCGLTADELERAALNAVRASYLPGPEKASMLSAFESEYARLRELDRPSK
jgi:aminodeoxyfutalosine deaminase